MAFQPPTKSGCVGGSLIRSPLGNTFLSSRRKALSNGLSPAENAQALARVWQDYQDTTVSGEQFARELGVSADYMRAAFTRYSKTTNLDVVLLGYLKQPEIPARREHIEEAFVLAQQVLASSGKGKP